MKYRLVRHTSLQRIVGGACLAVFGILSVVADQTILGGLLIVVGLMIGIPRATRTIAALLFGSMFYVVVLSVGYWSNTSLRGDTRTFAEWAQDNLLFIIVAGIAIFSMLAIYSRLRRSIWSDLEECFAETRDWTLSDEKYPLQPGLLKIDDEIYAVTSIATDRGLLVLNESGSCLVFRWEEIGKVSVVKGSRESATIFVKRKLPLPLEVEVPWNKQFSRYMPDRLCADAA